VVAGLLRLFVGDKYLGEPAPTGPIIAINSRSETGFLRKYLVTTHRLSKKPGFFSIYE
jgi:hypothetical protein